MISSAHCELSQLFFSFRLLLSAEHDSRGIFSVENVLFYKITSDRKLASIFRVILQYYLRDLVRTYHKEQFVASFVMYLHVGATRLGTNRESECPHEKRNVYR